MHIKNQIAVITGASSGIGEATAYALAQAGAHVILLARNETKLNRVLEKIITSGGQASAYPLDITQARGNHQTVSSYHSEVFSCL